MIAFPPIQAFHVWWVYYNTIHRFVIVWKITTIYTCFDVGKIQCVVILVYFFPKDAFAVCYICNMRSNRNI